MNGLQILLENLMLAVCLGILFKMHIFSRFELNPFCIIQFVNVELCNGACPVYFSLDGSKVSELQQKFFEKM